jgi:mRNA interferase MazF
MARILRGEIRWADLNPTRGHEQAGRRPVLILSHDVFNARSGTVIAVALTSQPQKAGFPLTHEISAGGLSKPTWAKISQIRTLSVERIGKLLASVASMEVDKIVEGLNEILGM